MNFLKNLFNKKEAAKPVQQITINTNRDFWDWFILHQQTFFDAVKAGQPAIERDFFTQLSPALNALRKDVYYVTGMASENVAELVISADGKITNIGFIENLVAEAPQLTNWKFTALKPALDIKDVGISMSNYTFTKENLSFYAEEIPGRPDELIIKVAHNDCTPENKNNIANGVFIFLDNFLGELNFATTIDHLEVISKTEATQELIPIEKLNAYLIWREKEFIEKHEGERHDTENDTYSSFEAKMRDGSPIIAIVNTALLRWDAKASHPWMLAIEMAYDGKQTNGLPDTPTLEKLNAIEDALMTLLIDMDGYLNVGRETGGNNRTVFMACKDFREPADVMDEMIKQHGSWISYDIYKDKYWSTFNKYMPGEIL